MNTWSDDKARATLRAIFDAAVASAAPGPAVLRHLPEKPRGRCVVVGAGKASAAMAAALDAAWPDVALSGVVVTRDGYAVPAGRIAVLEASHPVPDQRSVDAARHILAAVRGLGPDDLVIALISGGGSALMTLPAGAMTLADKQAVNRALIASGATIAEINAVRKHLSAIKGGRLAAAAKPARIVTLAISDVPGDDPATIASGPTVADPTTLDDVRAILGRRKIKLPKAAEDALTETPKPGEIASDVRLIATPALALAAAAEAARAVGLKPAVIGDALEGESREVGRMMAGLARAVNTPLFTSGGGAVLLSGGETTVTLGDSPGRGGPNTEFALSLAVALRGAPGIWALACDSDGIDGTDDAAGAIVTPDTLARAKALGADAPACLARHDSYSFFDALGDLVRTGPTRTNVNDIRAVLVT